MHNVRNAFLKMGMAIKIQIRFPPLLAGEEARTCNIGLSTARRWYQKLTWLVLDHGLYNYACKHPTEDNLSILSFVYCHVMQRFRAGWAT